MRTIKQAILLALFGFPILFYTLFGFAVIVPTTLLFDWIDDDQPSLRRSVGEALGMFDEFVTRVRNVR